jgi:transposase
MRCQAMLLKSEGRKSKAVASIVGMCHVSINSWLKRYKQEGIPGLLTKPGRGRKPLLNKATDEQAVIQAVQANRSRIAMAKAQWEATRSEASKPVGRQAFTTFLKALAQDINGLEKE